MFIMYDVYICFTVDSAMINTLISTLSWIILSSFSNGAEPSFLRDFFVQIENTLFHRGDLNNNKNIGFPFFLEETRK